MLLTATRNDMRCHGENPVQQAVPELMRKRKPLAAI